MEIIYVYVTQIHFTIIEFRKYISFFFSHGLFSSSIRTCHSLVYIFYSVNHKILSFPFLPCHILISVVIAQRRPHFLILQPPSCLWLFPISISPSVPSLLPNGLYTDCGERVMAWSFLQRWCYILHIRFAVLITPVTDGIILISKVNWLPSLEIRMLVYRGSGGNTLPAYSQPGD